MTPRRNRPLRVLSSNLSCHQWGQNTIPAHKYVHPENARKRFSFLWKNNHLIIDLTEYYELPLQARNMNTRIANHYQLMLVQSDSNKESQQTSKTSYHRPQRLQRLVLIQLLYFGHLETQNSQDPNKQHIYPAA